MSRIDTQRLEIDQVTGVGSVPKYVAVTPGGRSLLVSNWCSYDLSVIDIASGTETARLGVGRYPRGIAVSPDATTAYIALMGGTPILTLDLDDLALGSIDGVEVSPRHLVVSPDGPYLYATLNAEGVVIRIDLATDRSASPTTRRPRRVGGQRLGEHPGLRGPLNRATCVGPRRSASVHVSPRQSTSGSASSTFWNSGLGSPSVVPAGTSRRCHPRPMSSPSPPSQVSRVVLALGV